MEDSKIIWYIVLGAIYFLSKAFGKKKKPPEEQTPYAEDVEYVPETTTEKPNSFDDILKELTKEVIKEEPKPIPSRIEVDEAKPLVSETNPLPTYAPKSDYELKVEEANKLPSKTFISRDKFEYKRNKNFAIVEEENEIAQDIHDILADADGPKKAIILSEILNRKY